jgi:hypothetical protein
VAGIGGAVVEFPKRGLILMQAVCVDLKGFAPKLPSSFVIALKF